MGKMQQAKGENFERLVADLIAKALQGYAKVELNQAAQAARGGGRDLLWWLRTEDGRQVPAPFCIQCEHGKSIHPYKKLAEAQASALPGEVSAAILRQNYRPIIVAMTLDDWLRMVLLATSKLVELYNEAHSK